MSSLCVKFYELLNNNSVKYKNILNEIKTDSAMLRSCASQNNFINCNMIDYKKKFLPYYSFINYNSIFYNQNKIINLTTLSRDQILESINTSSLINLSNTVNFFETTYNDLLNNYTLEKYYFNTNNIYVFDKNLFIYNYLNSSYSTNFSSLLKSNIVINNDLLRDLNKHSFFHYYFLISFLNYYFNTYSSLKSEISNNEDYNYLLQFNLDLKYNEQLNQISEEICNIILVHQYNIFRKSNTLVSSLINSNIRNKVYDIVNIFNSWSTARSENYTRNCLLNIVDLLNHILSFTLTTKIFNLKNVFNFIGLNEITYRLYETSDISLFDERLVRETNFMTTISDFENQILDTIQGSLNNVYSLREYFNILYLYRNQVEKFINIIDYVASTYVFDNIRLSDIYYFNNFTHLKNLFYFWKPNVYINEFNREVTSFFTKTNQKALLSDNLLQLAFTMEFSRLLDLFINSEEFNEYITGLQKTFYQEFRSLSIIEKNIDWCSCDVVLKIYFKNLLLNLSQETDFFNISELKSDLETKIDSSTITYISDQASFDLATTNFIDLYAPYMFNFYINFITSYNGFVFSKLIHDIVKI